MHVAKIWTVFGIDVSKRNSFWNIFFFFFFSFLERMSPAFWNIIWGLNSKKLQPRALKQISNSSFRKVHILQIDAAFRPAWESNKLQWRTNTKWNLSHRPRQSVGKLTNWNNWKSEGNHLAPKTLYRRRSSHEDFSSSCTSRPLSVLGTRPELNGSYCAGWPLGGGGGVILGIPTWQTKLISKISEIKL